MSEPARQRMTPDDFLRWITTQERKHELVDGEPVMMAGANRRHDRIATRALASLANQLGTRRCQPFTSDTAVRIPAGNVRYPDLGVGCGPFDDYALEASEPALVVEILSPTTRGFDRNDKLEEYKTVGTLEYILLIDPDSPQVRLYWRDGGAWVSQRKVGLDAAVEMPKIGATLRLDDLYAGLQFRPRPTPVDREDEGPASTI